MGQAKKPNFELIAGGDVYQDPGVSPNAQVIRVLVVEDDLDIRPVILNVLRAIEFPFELTWERNAEAATKLVSDLAKMISPKNFDLIIVDLFLEGPHNGIEFLKFISDYYTTTPAFVISAADEAEVKKQMDCYAVWPHFLPKPLETVEFQKKIIEQLFGCEKQD